MKILLCCEFYAPSVGGVQEVIRQLAERLVVRGHSVTVATTSIPDRQSCQLNGVRIQEFSVSGNLVNGMQGDYEGYQQFAVEGDFDVVMIKAAQQWTFDALWPVLHRIRCGKVFIPCGFSCLYEPAYARYFQELPAILTQFDHLIFYASEYRDIAYAKQHGMTALSIIPNGASELEFNGPPDPSFRQRYGLCDQSLLFLTVGSPARMKGHCEILEAFLRADFSGRAATLLVNAGAGLAKHPTPRSHSIEDKCRDYWRVVRETGEKDGLASAVQYVGQGVLNKIGIRLGRYACLGGIRQRTVEDDLRTLSERIQTQGSGKHVMLTDLPRVDLVQAFRSADLFVFASYVEYSPLVLFESAASGTPFLSVPVGNATEIAKWTGGGVICPAEQDERGYTKVDPEVFGAYWSCLAKNTTYLHQLGIAGKRSWAAHFTWEKITEQYEAILQEVAIYAKA